MIRGHFGEGITGDDAILLGALAALRQQCRARRFLVISRPVEDAGHDVEWVEPRDVYQVMRAVRQADAVLLGGGNILADAPFHYKAADLFTEYRRTLLDHLAVALMATAAGKPTIVFGAGAGPLVGQVGRNLLPAVLSAVARFAVRDRASREALLALGIPGDRIEVTADLALLMPLPPQPAASREGATATRPDGDTAPVGVGVRPWFHFCLARDAQARADYERYLDRMKDLVARLAGATRPVLFIPMQRGGEDDHSAIDAVARRLPAGISWAVAEQGSRLNVARVVQGCHSLIAARLHHMVFAALTNTPCVAICYHDKMREFAREMGWEDRCFDISRFDAAQVASRLREVVSEWPRLGEECKARLEALKQRALRNAEIVTEVLNLWGKSPLRRGGKPVNQDAVDAASWQRRLAEVEKYADGLEAVLDAKDERIAALETTQRELQAARAELQAARAELQAARAEVQASHREADRLREELAVWSTWGTRVQRSLPYRAFRLLKRACRLGRSSP